jgi:hypothetical protein
MGHNHRVRKVLRNRKKIRKVKETCRDAGVPKEYERDYIKDELRGFRIPSLLGVGVYSTGLLATGAAIAGGVLGMREINQYFIDGPRIDFLEGVCLMTTMTSAFLYSLTCLLMGAMVTRESHIKLSGKYDGWPAIEFLRRRAELNEHLTREVHMPELERNVGNLGRYLLDS